jgi:hypothetical protein
VDSQPPFTWEHLVGTATAPLLKTLPNRFLDRLDDHDCIRIEWPWAFDRIAPELLKQGLLRLVIKAGKAMLLCADSGAARAPFMRHFKRWSICRISKIHHADHPVCFFLEKRRSIGGKRGPCKGWTFSTKRTSRNYCIALAELRRINGVLTIGPLPESAKLKSFQKAIHRLLKKWNIAHHGLWEGPNPHLHILLCSPVDEIAKKEIRGNIFACYNRHFGYRPQPPPNLVDLDLELKKGQLAAARYCGKTRKKDKNGGIYEQKAEFPWLYWQPYFSHGLPWKAMKEVIANLPTTPPEFCIKAMNRKKRDSSRSK